MKPVSPSCALLCAGVLSVWPVVSAAQPGAEPAPSQPRQTAETPQAEPFFSASGSLGFASRYLFQGIDYSEGKPVLNPEVDLSAGFLSTRFWMNHDLDQNEPTELDFSLLHKWEMKKLSIAGGYTLLRYPHREGWEPSQELFLEISREGPVDLSFSSHYDFDAGQGTYSTLGLSRSLENHGATWTAGVNLFYQDHYYALSGIPSAEINLRLTRALRGVSLTPSISRFVAWTNGDFRDENAVRSAWVFSFLMERDF